MAPPAPPVSANRGDAGSRWSSTLYQLVMTPVIFVSFLVSLALVDLKYSIRRSHYHADERPGRLPGWLHRLLYRYQRYQYVAVDEHGQPLSDKSSTPWYYHSKQKKLVKMEAADAFEIRSTVLVLLGLLSFGITWGTWRAITWGLAAVGLSS
ncbi:hypothetical protein B0T19DRAFT_71006 [Cercophora scortea]|uniref:Uncharacterized protein n=1 Tax=Cercophora scortea TaxID=314031 RepID=A0AAE0MN98_9PEZI|nr:hypothetical protein B0T19DRAFT_71006 [Cercophora scortea]